MLNMIEQETTIPEDAEPIAGQTMPAEKQNDEPESVSPETKKELPPVVPPVQDGTPVPLERDAYWHRVLTGNPDTIPQEVRELAGANDAALAPEQQEYTLFSAVNRSWLADNKGLPREEVMADWRTHRAELAGELGVAEDERELFMALSDREQESERRKVAHQVYEQAYYAGLHGDGEYDLKQISLPIQQADAETAQTVAEHAYEEGARLRERYMPLAQKLAEGLDMFAAAEEDVFSAPRVIAGVPGLAEATDRLSDMPEEERRVVEYLAVRLARQERSANAESAPEDEWLGSRAVRAVRRGAGNLGFGALQALNHAGIATLDNLGDWLGGGTGRHLQDSAAAWDKRMRVLNDIRHLSQQEAAPLLKPDSSRAERFFIEGTQAVPAAVLSCCGGAGFATLSLSGMGESVAEARRRAPDGPQQLQLAAGVLGGAVQGAIYMGMSRIGGRMLEQNIANFMKARGSGLANYTLAGLKSMMGTTAEGVKLMLAGKAAAATDLGVHELAARASGTASNIDWKQFGDNMTDLECNMREAANTLPFLLIGAGRAALHHFRGGSNSVLGSGAKLLEWNVPKEKVDAILQEQDSAARTRLLQGALRESDLWNNKRYSMDIMRAMSLLNTKGKPVFKDVDTVRDFLHLPASFRLPENTSAESASAKGSRKEAQDGMLLRDEWERLAGLWEGPGDLAEMIRTRGKGRRSLLNGRGTSKGRYYYAKDNVFRNKATKVGGSFYAPGREAWRREILNRHCDELRQLSYRLLLQFYSRDALTSSRNGGTETIAEEAANLRRRYFDMVQKAVLGRGRQKTVISRGRQVSEKEVFDEMARECGEMLRFYRGEKEEKPACSAWWIRNAPEYLVEGIEQYCLDLDHSRLLPHPELREFFWLMNRTRSCIAALNSLLPYSSDFQTLLSLNHSPAMAYEHLLHREFSDSDTPAPLSLTLAPVQEETIERSNIYKQMTGYEMESSVGDTGETLYRIKRADGTWTSWHNSPEAVMSVLAGNSALLFTPVRTPLAEFLRREFDNPECLRNLPLAGDYTYSGHDQLCGIAMHDLLTYWMESAAHMQPGLLRTKVRNVNRSLREGQSGKSLLELTEDGQYWVDSISTVTPFSFARNRFEVYWMRQLRDGMLSAENVANFLLDADILTPRQYEDCLAMQVPPTKPASRNVPLRETPFADVDGLNRRLAKGMSIFTLRYFFSRLMEIEVPQSVKHWFGLTAFSPIYQWKKKPSIDGKLPFSSSIKGHRELSWANHQSISQLHILAPYMEKYRRLYADELPDPDINRLMPAAISQDKLLQTEQAWAHYWGSAGSLKSSTEDLWGMMRFPAETWEKMPPELRKVYRKLLRSFCEKNAPAGLPKSGDVVESAIANLDTVLKLCPDLHRYSCLYEESAPDMVRALHVLTPEEMQFEGKTAIGNYEAEPETRADYSVELQKMPAFIAESPSVFYALQLLDILRVKSANNPYYNGQIMKWRGRRYGGDGFAPPGLKEWQPHSSMETMLELFEDMEAAHEGSDAVTYNAGGVEVPILRTEEITLPIFRQPTSYTWEKLPTYTYRLMPGSTDAADFTSRHPYIVGVRSGVPISAEKVSEDAVHPYVRTPMSEFVHTPYILTPLGNPVIRNLRFMAVHNELEQVCAIADKGADPESTLPPDSTELLELLLELYEDNGYNQRMRNVSFEELSGVNAEAYRLAANMIRCIAATQKGTPEEVSQAYAALKKTCDHFKADPNRMEELANTLAFGKMRIRRAKDTPKIEVDFSSPHLTEQMRELIRENLGIVLPEKFKMTPETRRIMQEWFKNRGDLTKLEQLFPKKKPEEMNKEELRRYQFSQSMGFEYIDRNWVNNLSASLKVEGDKYEENATEPETQKAQEEYPEEDKNNVFDYGAFQKRRRNKDKK